jgi:hypothetical protein
MPTMGKYCKAYLLEKMRGFSGWDEKAENARKETVEREGEEVEMTRDLMDDSIVYLQENYVVTDGVFRDENVLFDNVTPEWVAYCQQELEFEIPEYARNTETTKQAEEISAESATE